MRLLTGGSALIAAIAMIYAFGSTMRTIAAGFAAKEQVERLFGMADMLQSAAGQDDTNEVLRATAARLLPGFSGALYVFNNSRDRLDLATHWGPLGEQSADHLLPDTCWALKRGKHHLNGLEEGDLRCAHAADAHVKLARCRWRRAGNILACCKSLLPMPRPVRSGLPRCRASPVRWPTRCRWPSRASRCARSCAARRSGMSSPASTTDASLRRCSSASAWMPSGARVPVSAIMLDLDHFKKLNDQYGHGAGDAVLRDVAAAILSCLRGVDVACRYGGEEIAILLPDCPATMAMGKAEHIRSRIATLTGPEGASVTASLGVASMPELTGRASSLLAMADAALYQAKQQGRDRVVAAPLRPSAQRLNLIEPELASAPAG